jgi:hypothetical protein
MSKDEKDICLYCRWWRHDSNFTIPGMDDTVATRGHCHIAAPVVIQFGSFQDGLGARTVWKSTHGGEFCGEFKERDISNNAERDRT